MIVKSTGGYFVMSADGSRRLGGPYPTEATAMKKLEEIESLKAKMKGKR